MVEQVIDPINVPSITLSQTEIEEIDGLIAAEQFPAAFDCH
jgi:hypothetical protein